MHAHEIRHWWFRGRRRVLMNLLRSVAAARAGSLRILDYGCGTGGNTLAYASLGAVVGIEPDPVAVRLAQERGGARYCRTTGTQLPFRQGSFDAVVASDVLEHIKDDVAAVAEIARVTRLGGTAVISVPAHPWLFSEHDAVLHHFRRYSKAALRDVLQRNGFKTNRLSYWNAALFPVVCLRRLLGRRRSLHGQRSDMKSSPWMINELLAALLAAEAAVLRHLPLPWGLSLVAVAQRV
jgi:SAM-dependent methyltransferase